MPVCWAVLTPIGATTRTGWDTDQFPLDPLELQPCYYPKAGGLTDGGVNFDAKTRRNSYRPEDLFIAHDGGR